MELDLNKKEKTPTKPLITIVRGFPGSGKTLFGRSLAARQNGLFVEPDIVLYDRDSNYCYTPAIYRRAEAAAKNILTAYFEGGGTFAVYADVLPRKHDVWYFLRGLEMSTRWGLRIWDPDERHAFDHKVIDMPKITMEESRARNDHNVCDEDLKWMFENWEDWDGKY